MGLKGMSHPFPPREGAKTAESAVVDYHLDPEQIQMLICARALSMYMWVEHV